MIDIFVLASRNLGRSEGNALSLNEQGRTVIFEPPTIQPVLDTPEKLENRSWPRRQ
jgi:hypothetical protein